jgi:tol-pal system protein YbgF
MRAGRWTPCLALLLAGCLASKGDMALLQGQLRAMREASAQADSVQRVQIDRPIAREMDRVIAQISRNNDSIRAISVRLAKLQGDVQTDHYAMGQQLLQIQELTGQSQRRLQEMHASLEERKGSADAAPADSSKPSGPGPALLFQNSLDQLRRGSSAVARSGFEELIRTYPTYEDVPEAMVWIGDTYATERNQVAADSVYKLVIKQFPKSPKAATALYKRAMQMKAAGQMTAARAAFTQIRHDYPNSDEAELAQVQLRSIK